MKLEHLIPKNTVFFIGDSITSQLNNKAVEINSVNFGVGGQNTSELITSLSKYKSVPSASVIFFEMGINDLLGGKKAGLIDRYKKIFELLPKVPIIWTSIMPNANVVATDIIEINQSIKKLCEEINECYLVDSFLFMTSDKQKIDAFYKEDGTHINNLGYEAWLKAIKHVYPIHHP